MERIKKFNLEISLFVKQLNWYIENVNEINDETIGLLVDTVENISKLQKSAQFCEITTNETAIVNNLNNDIFECRPYIVCRLCSDHFPLSAQDFTLHCQKSDHKARENTQGQHSRVSYDNHLLRTTSLMSINDANSVNGGQRFQLKLPSSRGSLAYHGSIDNIHRNRSNTSPITPVASNLANDINVDNVSQAIGAKMIDLVIRSAERISSEKEIVRLLTGYFKSIDPSVRLVPFGSTTYGFGGGDTNFNILIDTSGSTENPKIILHSAGKYFKPPSVQTDFDILASIDGNRVHKKRLQIIHKQSGILCWLESDADRSICESSQIIRDFISYAPICYHLIAYVRAWLNAVNEAAVAKGAQPAIRFNTYIVSVLVVFYLQMHQQFPKLADVPPSQSKHIWSVSQIVDRDYLKRSIREFFDFYGKKYELKNQLISVNIGRWQDPQLEIKKTNFTPEQKSLRDGIESNAWNWKNCFMFVQDLKLSGTNITAEVSRDEANNFIQMCNRFASSKSYEVAIDNYVMKLSQVRSTSMLNLRESSMNAKQNMNSSVVSKATPNFSSNNRPTTSNGMAKPISTQTLLNSIDMKKVSHAIPAIAVDLVYRMVKRCFTELEIQAQLTRHFKELDSKLEVMPFGSATYGFGGSHTDFNILVNADGAIQSAFQTSKSIELLFTTHGLQSDFKLVSIIRGDRVQKKRIEVIHNTSGISCSIQVNLSFELVESSQIIRNCIMHSPICYHLIAYVRAWQIAVNEMAVQNGHRYAFRLNTYITSVLVIFFLQVKHNFPKLADVPQSQAKSIDFVPRIDEADRKKFEAATQQFFEFYGKVYEKCKLISLDMGRWQNRRLDRKQSGLTPDRKKLETSIESSPQNWKSCTMFVQDVNSPGVNITAELTEEEVDNFRALCRMFASSTFRYQLTDKYLLELSQVKSASHASMTRPNVHSAYESASHSSQNFKNEMAKEQPIRDEIDSTNDHSDDVVADGSLSSVSPQSIDIDRQSATKLKNLTKIDEVLTSTQIRMNEILSRSSARVESEHEIIDKFSFLLTTFDPDITVLPFGSVTFGFGGPQTDFNILITEGTSLTSRELEVLIEDLLKTTGLQQDFEFLSNVQDDRTHFGQLKVLHKDSNIVCVLNFSTKAMFLQSEKATKIIRDYMSLHPMCKRLIAYVRAWQNVLNEKSVKSGSVAFKMNSYVIAVLVIFYLQLSCEVPTVTDLSLAIANESTFSPKKSFDEYVKEFFKLYGQKFELNVHLISVHVGKWQQKDHRNQKPFSSPQKILRDGMAMNPKDWENCPMCVQDIVSLSTNITAGISKQEVEHFVQMCQLFAKQSPNCNDECATITIKSTSTIGLPFQSLEQETDFFSLIKKEVSDSRMPAALEIRKRVVLEITSKLATYIQNFNRTLKLYPFGSTQYNVQFANANSNLLISTNGEKSKEISQRFLHKIQQTDALRHFKKIYKKSADRVLKRQISMIHIESGIECLILFQKTPYIVESTEVLKRFATNSLCNDLIAFVRMWQNILSQRGIARIEFNTYIISVLVIFFLQINYGYPTVDQVMHQNSTVCSKPFNMKIVLRNFFEFYGNQYDMLNHIISANIGQWQDRRTLFHQSSSTLAQTRLRSAIKTSPENWEDCPMLVQDLVRSNVNITAEISKSGAENFQKMCKKFATEL